MLAVIDLKTTGLNPSEGHVAWDFGYAEVPRVTPAERVKLEALRADEQPFTPPVVSWGMNLRLHETLRDDQLMTLRDKSISGLTDREIQRLFADDATEFGVALQVLRRWLRGNTSTSRPPSLTSWNRSFDWEFLQAQPEWGALGLETEWGWDGFPFMVSPNQHAQFQDPMVQAAMRFSGHELIRRPGFIKLGAACDLLHIPRGGHRAQSDAVAAARVAAWLGMGQ